MNNAFCPLDFLYQIKWPERVTLATEGDASRSLSVPSPALVDPFPQDTGEHEMKLSSAAEPASPNEQLLIFPSISSQEP